MPPMINYPSWFATASAHARACWLVDCKHEKNYSDARRHVGRLEAQCKARPSVAEYQSTLAIRGLS